MCLDLEYIAFGITNKLCSETFETQEMSIQASTSDLISAGFGHGCLAEAPQQWANHEHTSTK